MSADQSFKNLGAQAPSPAALREQLRHVFWIGGGSCAGKSTVARRIAAQYGLHLYKTDDVMAEHGRRSTPENCPFLREFIAMNMDERWLNRSPATMLETFHWFKGERFNMIIEDLLSLPADRRVIVEGFGCCRTSSSLFSRFRIMLSGFSRLPNSAKLR